MKKVFYRKEFTATVTDVNGYISLTGNINGSSGAVGDKIAAVDDEFVPINNCHLCDAKTGFPMHCIDNAVHLLKNRINTTGYISLKEIYPFFAELLAPECEDYEDILDDCVIDCLAEITTWPSDATFILLHLSLRDSDLLKIYFANRLAECYEAIDEIEERDIDHYTYDPEYTNEVNALAKFLDIPCSDVDDKGDCRFRAEGSDYIVADDDDADALARESLQNYVEDCVLSEIPNQYQLYFDTERFIEDVLSQDGRGPTLSSWDGEEKEVEIEDTTYFIYRN